MATRAARPGSGSPWATVTRCSLRHARPISLGESLPDDCPRPPLAGDGVPARLSDDGADDAAVARNEGAGRLGARRCTRTGGSTKRATATVEQLVQLVIVEEADDRPALVLELLTSPSCDRHARCPHRGQRRGDCRGVHWGRRGSKPLDFPVPARGSSPPPRTSEPWLGAGFAATTFIVTARAGTSGSRGAARDGAEQTGAARAESGSRGTSCSSRSAASPAPALGAKIRRQRRGLGRARDLLGASSVPADVSERVSWHRNAAEPVGTPCRQPARDRRNPRDHWMRPG